MRLLILLLLSVSLSAQVPPTYFGMHTLTHWPTVSFGAMRSANVSWGAVEPARGVYNWTNLDAWVSHQVPINYLFLNTPSWAGPSSTLPPAQLQDWNDFVTAIVTRYKGRIASYELWNEPNSTSYWTGTTVQLVEMSRRAYTIIKSVDPSAEVLTPSPTWTSTTAWQWMDAYLNAGGGAYADVIAYHGYTGNTNGSSTIIVDSIAAVLKAHSITKPMWMTEGGWGTNVTVPNTDDQLAFLAQRYLLYWSRGVERFYWYQWDNPNWGTLWGITGNVNVAGIAYQQVYNWMVGATAALCTKDAAATWSCNFTRSDGYRARALWNTSTPISISISNFSQYRDLSGGVHPSIGSIIVGNAPILLETGPPPAPTSLTTNVH